MGHQPARLTHPVCGLEARRAYTVPALKVFSEEKRFAQHLKRGEDEMAQKMGYDQSFVAVDINDKKTLGVTDEGLDEQAKKHRELGWSEAKTRTFT